MYDMACVVHVHSTFSDGTATVQEILGAAREAGAEAVLLTDHDSLEAARHGLEGWRGGVLLLVGHEISTRRGHLLAFGLEQEVDHEGRSEREIWEAVSADGGIGFAAHPFSRGGAVPSIIRPHPWDSLAQCAGMGVELWSLVTDAAERWRTPADVVGFLRHPERSLNGPPVEHLSRWDELCKLRRVAAIGGLDAHQTGIRVRRRVLSPMPNGRYFKLLQTHVLLEKSPSGELDADRAAVYRALAAGCCYLASDAIAPPQGFRFWAESRDGRIVQMGAETSGGSWVLRATTPRSAILRVIRDGQTIRETLATSLEQPVMGPGVYRVETRLQVGNRKRVWIVSNPIYLR
jgi:hypothetical protein